MSEFYIKATLKANCAQSCTCLDCLQYLEENNIVHDYTLSHNLTKNLFIHSHRSKHTTKATPN